MPRSIGTCCTFLGQRVSKPFEADFAEGLCSEATSALKLWIALVIFVSCGSAFVPNYLYISLATVALSLGALSVLRIMKHGRWQQQWEKLAVVYSLVLLLMAPCTDQLNLTTHWMGAADPGDLPRSSSVAALRAVLFFCGSLMVPVPIYLAVSLLAVAATSLLHWKYLLALSGGPSMGIEESDLAALGCLLVVIVSGWKREECFRKRFLAVDNERMGDRDRLMSEMQTLQALAKAFEQSALELCDVVVEVDEELYIADQPRSGAAFLDEPASRRSVLDFIAPADRVRVESLLRSLRQTVMRRPFCTTVMVQKPGGGALWSDLLVFSTSQHGCVVGFHFKAREGAPKAEGLRLSQQHESHRSDMSALLEYSASSVAPSTMASTATFVSRLQRQSESEAPESGSQQSTMHSTLQTATTAASASGDAPSAAAARLQEQRASPRAGRLPETGQNPTREAAVQTERPPMEDAEASAAGSDLARARRYGRPPRMPESPSTSFSGTPSCASSLSRASSGTEGAGGGVPAAAVFMSVEMCRATRRTCCQFHGSAALVAKVAKKMRNLECDQRWRPNDAWQCPSCFCMLSSEPDVCSVCAMPNPERQRHARLAL